MNFIYKVDCKIPEARAERSSPRAVSLARMNFLKLPPLNAIAPSDKAFAI